MKFSFHPEAETEFLESIDFFENQEPDLGRSFSAEVFSTILRILEYPLAWPVLEYDVRRCLTHRFPYSVLYSVEKDGIFILAIMHHHREPGYWRSRET